MFLSQNFFASVACSYEGEYYDPKDGQCKKCPIGTYKLASDKQVLQCTKCPTNHTTNRIGAASVSECIGNKIISSFLGSHFSYLHCCCRFLLHNYHKIYVKRKVVISLKFVIFFTDSYDNCSPNPCKFPGWCEDTGMGFKCHCPHNYVGKYCENRMLPYIFLYSFFLS